MNTVSNFFGGVLFVLILNLLDLRHCGADMNRIADEVAWQNFLLHHGKLTLIIICMCFIHQKMA